MRRKKGADGKHFPPSVHELRSVGLKISSRSSGDVP